MQLILYQLITWKTKVMFFFASWRCLKRLDIDLQGFHRSNEAPKRKKENALKGQNVLERTFCDDSFFLVFFLRFLFFPKPCYSFKEDLVDLWKWKRKCSKFFREIVNNFFSRISVFTGVPGFTCSPPRLCFIVAFKQTYSAIWGDSFYQSQISK